MVEGNIAYLYSLRDWPREGCIVPRSDPTFVAVQVVMCDIYIIVTLFAECLL